VNVLYDAGVLVAADRGDRIAWAEHRARLEIGLVPITTAAVVAQVSRSGQQAQLRRLLRGCEIVPFDPDQAHEVGALLGASRTSDVVDAHVVVVAATRHGTIITSDTGDLDRLAAHVARPLRIERI